MATSPICAERVQCVPPQGVTSKSPTDTTRTPSLCLGGRLSDNVASSS